LSREPEFDSQKHDAEGVPRCEVTPGVEDVVDGGMNGQEALH
jgi:hypothetical protein